MKWITKTEYVDLDTGEIITRNHVKKGLYIVNRVIKLKTEYNETKTTAIQTFRKECRVQNQTKIEFGKIYTGPEPISRN